MINICRTFPPLRFKLSISIWLLFILSIDITYTHTHPQAAAGSITNAAALGHAKQLSWHAQVAMESFAMRFVFLNEPMPPPTHHHQGKIQNRPSKKKKKQENGRENRRKKLTIHSRRSLCAGLVPQSFLWMPFAVGRSPCEWKSLFALACSFGYLWRHFGVWVPPRVRVWVRALWGFYPPRWTGNVILEFAPSSRMCFSPKAGQENQWMNMETRSPRRRMCRCMCNLYNFSSMKSPNTRALEGH